MTNKKSLDEALKKVLWLGLPVALAVSCKTPAPPADDAGPTPSARPTQEQAKAAPPPSSSAPSSAPVTSASAAPRPPPSLPPLSQGAILTINISEGRNPILSGETNLPDGTQLTARLDEGPCEWVLRPGGTYSQDVVVSGGRWVTTPLAQGREEVRDGTFEASILMPYPQTQNASVQAVIGANGERLRGRLVKNKGDGDVTVENSRKVVFGSPPQAAALTRQRCASTGVRMRELEGK